jgi:hypothetical protein
VTPNLNNGIKSTTGGTTINETMIASRDSLPWNGNRAKPQAAKAASAKVRMTEKVTIKNEFKSQVGNESDHADL